MAMSYWEFCTHTVEDANEPASMALRIIDGEIVARVRDRLGDAEDDDALHELDLLAEKIATLEQMVREPAIAYEDGERLTDSYVRARLRGMYGEDREPTWAGAGTRS